MSTSAVLAILMQASTSVHAGSIDNPVLEAKSGESAATARLNSRPALEIIVPKPHQPPSVTIPKAHPILIIIQGKVGSKISEGKDFFPIELAQAVIIDGHEVLPAGIKGEGQVVHAKKGGLGGRGGELVLAARYLMHEGRKIPLRSFKFINSDDDFAEVGTDNTNIVGVSSAVAGPLAFLISGGNTTIEPGTLAKAKIRQATDFLSEEKVQPSADSRHISDTALPTPLSKTSAQIATPKENEIDE